VASTHPSDIKTRCARFAAPHPVREDPVPHAVKVVQYVHDTKTEVHEALVQLRDGLNGRRCAAAGKPLVALRQHLGGVVVGHHVAGLAARQHH
jgi:hypothetical protein